MFGAAVDEGDEVDELVGILSSSTECSRFCRPYPRSLDADAHC